MPRDVVIVDCEEYDLIEVDPDLWMSAGHQAVFNSEIDGRDILRASFSKGVLRLQATSYIGVIPINDRLIVRVRPRVPIGNLTRMVKDTGHRLLPLSALREYAGRGTADDWLMDLYADALLDHIDVALDSGLLRTYERKEDEGHFPHGRIDFTRTLQRFAARGIPNKAAFSWHERQIDTPENRCVKAAMETIHAHLRKKRAQQRKGDRAKLARLAGQLRAFEEVSDDPELRFLTDPHVLGLAQLPDPRAYYRPLLDLAVLIAQGTGIGLELGGADVRISSLLIDTNNLFENFVRISLSRHAAKDGWPVNVLDGNTTGRVDLYHVPVPPPAPLGVPMQALASTDPGKAQPDIVLSTPEGGVVLIAEVKNTTHGKKAQTTNVLPERGEVEQAVTYALRYGLEFTLLIHPWTRGVKGLIYVGRVRTIDVYDYRLDLSSAANIDAAIADMAQAVAALGRLGQN